MGRLSVRSLRDIRRAEAPVALIDDHSSRAAEPVPRIRGEPAPDSPAPGDGTAPRHRGLLDRFRRRDTASAP
ncbi:hypothetical protein C6A85_65070 [Mycobacterium sp. ITM-2017-0098]|nr:hypothetical protein C6A85_65070 [Mycobacterium sp. ITM-2017-0098]